MFDFCKLDVYQKALDFADGIICLSEGFPKGYYYLSNQLSRAALSIPANIAEGNGRFTKADRKNFFIIARGSIQECVPLLELAQRRGLIDETGHHKFRDELEILAKMTSGLIKGIDRRSK